MARVSITVNNRPYQIACDDGQEQRLMVLAKDVDARVNQMVAAVGQVGDAHLLVLASLMVADELADLRKEFEGLRSRQADQLPLPPPPVVPPRDTAAERRSEEQMAALAKRIEGIAERLEQA